MTGQKYSILHSTLVQSNQIPLTLDVILGENLLRRLVIEKIPLHLATTLRKSTSRDGARVDREIHLGDPREIREDRESNLQVREVLHTCPMLVSRRPRGARASTSPSRASCRRASASSWRRSAPCGTGPPCGPSAPRTSALSCFFPPDSFLFSSRLEFFASRLLRRVARFENPNSLFDNFLRTNSRAVLEIFF